MIIGRFDTFLHGFNNHNLNVLNLMKYESSEL